ADGTPCSWRRRWARRRRQKSAAKVSSPLEDDRRLRSCRRAKSPPRSRPSPARLAGSLDGPLDEATDRLGLGHGYAPAGDYGIERVTQIVVFRGPTPLADRLIEIVDAPAIYPPGRCVNRGLRRDRCANCGGQAEVGIDECRHRDAIVKFRQIGA